MTSLIHGVRTYTIEIKAAAEDVVDIVTNFRYFK